MKVWVHPGDNRGVGRYRMLYPAAAVRELGVDVEERDNFPMKREVRPGPNGGYEGRVRPGEVDADVVVFQRPSNLTLVEFIPLIQAMGVAVVVDVDDDLHAVHHRNVAKMSESPKNVLRACAMADMVTVATPALAERYGSHGRVAVLPNRVPERLLGMPPHRSDEMTVGWAGWVGTHPGDLQVTGGGVADAIRRVPGARFKMIGPVDGVQQALHLDEEPVYTGGLPIDDYYDELGSLDVGICPLEDSKFNQAKSCLKVLEMASRGVAVVASPRPDYRRMADEGICVLANDRGRSWRSQVKTLLENKVAWVELVAHARGQIQRAHTYEGTGHLWAEVWEQALANRHAGRKVAA